MMAVKKWRAVRKGWFPVFAVRAYARSLPELISKLEADPRNKGKYTYQHFHKESKRWR